MQNTTSKNIKLFREKNKLTIEQVSKFLNIETELYLEYEKGEKETPLEILEQLENLFGVYLEAFFKEEINESDLFFAVCDFSVFKDEDISKVADFKATSKVNSNISKHNLI